MIKIYNINNHKLDSEKLTFLHTFNSDNFCGVALSPQGQNNYISNVFVLDSNGKVDLNTALIGNDAVESDGIRLINSGAVLKLDNDDFKITPETNQIYYVKYTTGYMNNEDNIYSDEFDEAILDHQNFVSYTALYYNINGEPVEASDESAQGHTSSIVLSDGNTLNYSGQSITLSLKNDNYLSYIIPLFLYDGTRLISLVEARNKSSLEQWLSAKSLDNLWDNLHKTFTHKAGSTGGNDYGKLADFDFSGSNISHNDTAIITVTGDNKFIFPTYRGDKVNSLYVDIDGNVVSGTLPIEAGGTGGSTKNEAKNNLGMYYGLTDPADYFAANSLVAEEGDLYFKLLD